MGLNHIKIGRRLALAFALVLLITAAIAAIGIWRLQALEATTQQITQIDNERLRASMQWRQGIELNWTRTRAAIFGHDARHFAELQAEMEKTSNAVTGYRNTVERLVATDAGRQLIAQIDQAREAYRVPRAELLKRKANGEDVSALLEQQLIPLAAAYNQSLQVFEERQLQMYEATREAAAAAAQQGRWIILCGTALALAIGACSSWLLSRSVSMPLEHALRNAEHMAEGDLTQNIHVHGRDETATLLSALQHMQRKLAEVVADVRSNAESVATASAQIALGNRDLSTRTESQASALQETAASMEQLGATVRHNAEHARQANQLALDASQVAALGGQVVSQVVQTMHGIHTSSSRIADIIGVIDGIAFQTNILALNAAVEAARAGEQGRGFAVVASEVRALAQRSADAAKEIKHLISASVQQVEQGSQLVNKAGTTMTDVVSAIRRVTDIMQAISAASSQQSQGVLQVSEAVTQMDQVTQQNAALVEESAAAANSLQTQASQLVQAVAVFQLPPGTSGHRPTSASAHLQPPSLAPAARSLPRQAPTSVLPALQSPATHAKWDNF